MKLHKTILNVSFVMLTFLICVQSTSTFAQSGVALIYNGVGACPEDCANAAAQVARLAGLSPRYINADNWNESLFVGAKVWIQPGGVAHVAARALTHLQKERIRSFVADGGGYVGFCAGGFFAGLYKNDPSDKDPVEVLGILPVETDVYETTTQASIIPMDWLGVPRFLYFEGGPFFVEPLPQNIEVVSRYPNNSAATVRSTYHNGRVFVTGLHPEAPQYWRDDYHLVDPDGLDLDLAKSMVDWAIRAR